MQQGQKMEKNEKDVVIEKYKAKSIYPWEGHEKGSSKST